MAAKTKKTDPGVTIGRIVHYRGSEYGYSCKAAIVDHVHENEMVNLVIFPSFEPGVERRTSVYFEDNAPRDDAGNVGSPSWHWPERD